MPEFSTCPKSSLFTFSDLTFPFSSETANKGNYVFLLSLPMDIVSSDHWILNSLFHLKSKSVISDGAIENLSLLSSWSTSRDTQTTLEEWERMILFLIIHEFFVACQSENIRFWSFLGWFKTYGALKHRLNAVVKTYLNFVISELTAQIDADVTFHFYLCKWCLGWLSVASSLSGTSQDTLKMETRAE